ncbi:MAG TPA: isocitrate lyase/phosphoenolpyruvate mutase family protein [Pyrinomonadaceae bacterium]|jgi:2-methylisocitrate lyase-like PEP mutase family enzyme|nr:isocitrate lyase/phosphoenolpyruvate mutase family protein [Pyrinomonadaceae bacterium]
MSKQSSAIETFRALHESGCFVLPNPWDAGSAIYLERAGFKALATTSAGFAFSKGLPDGPAFVPRDMMLDHFRDIATATDLPVNADFQNGYADEPEAVAESVRFCVATGVAGLSIEDSTGDNAKPLYDFDLAVARIIAARDAIDSASGSNGSAVVLTARCEAYLVGAADPLHTSLERLVAFSEAGADCLYAPGVTDLQEISQIVKAVAPKPVNVLVSTNNCNVTVTQLADLGVRRISVGGALARAAWSGFIRAASEIQEQGTFKSFADATPFGELTEMFLNRL